ncbi:hypothetical protein EDD86DRAFT_246746 [Gorgonomyces haynaldii]|nr:hypothetical protein EDD86DRAFT_246746 [Gorgonomyces haynaldii]
MFAIKTRLAVIASVYVCYLLVSPYDTSSQLLNINQWFQPWIRWDAVYMADIAFYGYRFEQQFAFMPGYPFLMHYAGKVMQLFGLDTETGILLSGLLISNWSVVLSLEMGLDEDHSKMASVLFCLSPYAESLFALLTFYGMLLYLRRQYLLSSLVFGVSGLVRANGILYSGFFVWNILHLQWKTKFKSILCFFVSLSGFLGVQYYAHTLMNNGLLKYWTVQQLPNFVLFLPVGYTTFCAIVDYYRSDPMKFLSLGFKRRQKTGYYGFKMLPFVRERDSI